MNIKELREKHDLTQVELAARLGVGGRTIQNWEINGKVPRSKELLIRQIFGENTGNGVAAGDVHGSGNSVAAAPNAQVSIGGGGQQQTLDRILDEMVSVRGLLQEQLKTKDGQIDKLLGILAQQK